MSFSRSPSRVVRKVARSLANAGSSSLISAFYVPPSHFRWGGRVGVAFAAIVYSVQESLELTYVFVEYKISVRSPRHQMEAGLTGHVWSVEEIIGLP